MFDVFTEEIEVLIKDGIANLYWYKGDLHKAWMRYGVPSSFCTEIGRMCDGEGQLLTKRRQLDVLYERLRLTDYNRRLEVSRNFVRILVEQKTFVPQHPSHRVEIAERVALKLREMVRAQEQEREARQATVRRPEDPVATYHKRLAALYEQFKAAHELPPQEKGTHWRNSSSNSCASAASRFRNPSVLLESSLMVQSSMMDTTTW